MSGYGLGLSAWGDAFKPRWNIVLLVTSLVIAAAGQARSQGPGPIETTDFKRELMDELKNNVPQDNKKREERLVELYRQAQMGVPADQRDEVITKVIPGKDGANLLRNVIVTMKGRTDSVIIVGGHLDKVPPGDGVIDDWSGACLATNLYQTLKSQRMQHTFVFVGFAYEEDGLLGSHAYVDALTEVQKRKVAAMVNMECFGVDNPIIWANGSTDSLENIARRAADQYGLPLSSRDLTDVDADSSPFRDAGIPSITIDGLPSNAFRLIHSDDDKASNIREEAYLNAYRLMTRFLLALDRELPGSDAFVEPTKAQRPYRPQLKDRTGVDGDTSFREEAGVQKFFFVRHAEREDDSRDSPISTDGRKRADRLADLLEFDTIGAIYTTQFRRTIQTAEPLGRRTGVAPKEIELPMTVTGGGRESVADWSSSAVRRIREEHRSGNVLVVGHDATVPSMIKALSPEAEVFEIGRQEYDNFIVVILKAGRSPKVIRLRY